MIITDNPPGSSWASRHRKRRGTTATCSNQRIEAGWLCYGSNNLAGMPLDGRRSAAWLWLLSIDHSGRAAEIDALLTVEVKCHDSVCLETSTGHAAQQFLLMPEPSIG
jgi:hypothetical protein